MYKQLINNYNNRVHRTIKMNNNQQNISQIGRKNRKSGNKHD